MQSGWATPEWVNYSWEVGKSLVENYIIFKNEKIMYQGAMQVDWWFGTKNLYS